MVDSILIRELEGDRQGQDNEITLSLNGPHPYMDTGSYQCGASNGVQGKAASLIQTHNTSVIIPGKYNPLSIRADSHQT